MKSGKRTIERMAGAVTPDHPPMLGETITELYSDQRVLVEGHKGLVEYGTEKISVRVKFGKLCVCGMHLKVVHMTQLQLIIKGQITSIKLTREAQ